LGLIGGLALACFAKVDGVVFLGNPRGAAAREAREVTLWMRAPMVVLAGACVALGVVPALALAPALRVASAMTATASGTLAAGLRPVLAGANRVTVLASALLAMVLVAALARKLLLARRVVSEGDTWACGHPEVTPRMQYTAASFAAPLLATFGMLGGVVREQTALAFHTRPVDLILDRAARPLWEKLQSTAAQLRWMQSGRLHWYLLYVLATLAILLAYLGVRGIR
jgi:hypothetical protein